MTKIARPSNGWYFLLVALWTEKARLLPSGDHATALMSGAPLWSPKGKIWCPWRKLSSVTVIVGTPR